MNEDQQKVWEYLGTRELLEQLAEEAAELNQAALKLIRARGLSYNPTPVGPDEAWANLKEEVGDVLAVTDLLELTPGVSDKHNPKWKRWADRLEGLEK
jgi:NTP pyrophosphatase (non-canonical NTP hydrolase)